MKHGKPQKGKSVPRTAGTPQGGAISPTLANLFLHYGRSGKA
jgi:retron-type reverse transcriptase